MSSQALRPIEHLHTYVRVKHPKRRDIFMCNDPSCSHRINAMYLLGKRAKCYYCGDAFIIERKHLTKQSYLHCFDNCKKGVSPQKFDNELLERKLDEILGKHQK